MHSIAPLRLRALALSISAAVAASLLLAFTPAVSATADTAPVDPATPTTVSTDALPTAQINGVVWSQAIVGDIVYAGGNFSSARPAGSAKGVNESPRQNLMSFNIKTGVMTSFAPTMNGEVRAVAASPDGSRLYIGGTFDTVNGQGRYRVAAFDTTTGALITSFKPVFNTRVNAIVATNSAVYVGGWFTSVTSAPRTYVAKLDAATGAVSSSFNPTLAGGTVAALALSPDQSQLIVGGSFTTLNGSNGADGTGTGGYGLASVSTADGSNLPWHVNGLIRNGGTQAGITSLTSDSDGVYGTGYVFGQGGNLEGMFHASWTNGDLVSMESCHGDSYSAAPIGDVVYVASHSHYCGADGGFPQTSPDWTVQRSMAWTKSVQGTITHDSLGYYDFGGNPRPGILDWWPDLTTGSFTGQGQAAWSVVANSQYVVLGGEFPDVNKAAQQGLTRFAVKSIAPNTDGPRLSGANYVPTAVSLTAGTARITWPANYDRDNANLKYQLIRNNATATPVYTTNAISHIWWSRPNMGFVDTGLTPGQTYTYQLRVTDPYGNLAKSNPVTVTIATTGSLNAYDQQVIGDGASSYWRLSETSGTAAIDSVGFNDSVISGGVTQGASGAIIGDADTADTFNGTNGLVSTQTAIPGPDTFALEGWFKTTSTSGGKIVGFGNSNSGTSSSYDRHVYMDPAGHLVFGVYTGNTVTVQGSKTYNDGAWHYFNASMSSAGMKLSVDGAKVGQNTSTTAGQVYNGYWRIGGDSSWNGNPFFNGSIDDVAIYPAPLTQAQINNHYVASGRTSTVTPSPTDAYGAAVYAAQPDLYWRLGESSGNTAKDSGQLGNDGTYQNSPTLGATGAINGTTNTAATFNGANQFVSSNGTFSDPQVYTEEIWFNTTTTDGGKLIGFGNSQTGNSNSYDRHIWMQNSGRLAFGTYTGQENVALSDNSYNDGQWHYAVATQSSAGLKLYVDGSLVATNPQTAAEHHDGIWRVGGDVTWENSNSYYFKGKLDDAAVYPTALDATTIAAHYQLGTGSVPNVAPTASFTSSSNELVGSFNGSGSTDSDGTITSYAWDFGDGSSTTGATPDHAYATKGTYQVTLTVTDNSGATNAVTHAITVSKANLKPLASFTKSATGLSVSFDGTGSTDSDGTITSYAWNYGDGTSDTGATPTHTFTAGGSKTVTLTVTDDGGLTDTATQTFTLTAPNVAPSASFTSSVTGLSVALDGTGSSDSDGTVASYAWDFGDGTSSTQPSPTKTYAIAGTYSVKLTVTDDGGLSDSSTKSITVAAASTTIASDSFTRTATNGFGTANVGGAWTTSSASNYSVESDGKARIRNTKAGSTLEGYLSGVSSSDTDLTVSASLDQAVTGTAEYLSAVGRRIGTNDYRARVKVVPSGALTLQVLGAGGTSLGTANLTGTLTPGAQVKIRVQVTGTSPTTVRARAWLATATEPSTWQVTASNSDASLQAAGSIGIGSYLSSNATTFPLDARFDDLIAVPTSGTVTPPPANVKPTAAFTSSTSNLTASFNGSGSSDSDGNIASYAWSFGDGATSAATSPTHTYATAGTYTVKLVVTDNGGLTDSKTDSVTVTTAAANAIANDAFTRTVATGWGTSDLGGAWTTAGTAANYAVAGGVGSQKSVAGQTLTSTLAGVSATSSDTTVQVAMDKVATGTGFYFTVIGRQVGSAGEKAQVKIAPTGVVTLSILSGTTALKSLVVPGLTYTAGDVLNVHLQVFGTSPTTVRANVWKAAAGANEPTGWQVTGTDATAALQVAGSIALQSFQTSTSTNAPVTASFGKLVVVAAQ